MTQCEIMTSTGIIALDRADVRAMLGALQELGRAAEFNEDTDAVAKWIANFRKAYRDPDTQIVMSDVLRQVMITELDQLIDAGHTGNVDVSDWVVLRNKLNIDPQAEAVEKRKEDQK